MLKIRLLNTYYYVLQRVINDLKSKKRALSHNFFIFSHAKLQFFL